MFWTGCSRMDYSLKNDNKDLNNTTFLERYEIVIFNSEFETISKRIVLHKSSIIY